MQITAVPIANSKCIFIVVELARMSFGALTQTHGSITNIGADVVVQMGQSATLNIHVVVMNIGFRKCN